jgi:GT2 family glycosyltransferase
VRISEIAVVHHRTPAVLARALGRLARFAPDLPVRVLDTAPEPGAAERVRDAHPGARLEAVPNHSYAAAANRALRDATGPLVAVMNADVMIAADTLPGLTAPFHDPAVAVTGPLARTPDGALQDQGLPYRLATGALRGRGAHAVREVSWLSGCLFVARTAAARDAGGLDATLRFGNEDLEWCLRLRSRGWRCLLSAVEVEHLGGASTPDAGRFLVEGLRGGMVIARRHHGPLRSGAQRAAVGAYAAVRARAGRREARPTWAAVERMMRRGAFGASPFGATLADDAPGFPHDWPPRGAR